MQAGEARLCLCAVKDVFSNRIVGYSLDSRMKPRVAVAALDNTVPRRNADGASVAGCVLHTRPRAQFRYRKLVHALNRDDMVRSTGHVGAASNNASMESLFALLQRNALNHRTWATGEELRIAIVTWIERTYHRRRRQAALGELAQSNSSLPYPPTATQAA